MAKYKLIKELPISQDFWSLGETKEACISISESSADIGEYDPECLGLDTPIVVFKIQTKRGYIEFPQHHDFSILDYFKEVPRDPKSVWDLRPCENYYHIRDCIVDRHLAPTVTDVYNDQYRFHLNGGNCFADLRSAELELEKRLAIQKIKKFVHDEDMEFEPDWRDRDQDKWGVYYSHQTKRLDVKCYNSLQPIPGLIPYLKNKEDAGKVIEKFRLELELIFGIK